LFCGKDDVAVERVAEDLGDLFQARLRLTADCGGDFVLPAGKLNVHSLRSLLWCDLGPTPDLRQGLRFVAAAMFPLKRPALARRRLQSCTFFSLSPSSDACSGSSCPRDIWPPC